MTVFHPRMRYDYQLKSLLRRMFPHLQIASLTRDHRVKSRFGSDEIGSILPCPTSSLSDARLLILSAFAGRYLIACLSIVKKLICSPIIFEHSLCISNSPDPTF